MGIKRSTHMATALAAAGMGILAVGGGACTFTRPVPADVRVPPDILRGAPYTAGGDSPRSRYVVRMTDGQRDWEIQLPEIATAYEVKVPLTGKPGAGTAIDLAAMTAADREILADRTAAAQERQPDADGADRQGSGRAGRAADDDDDDDDAAASRKSKLRRAAGSRGTDAPMPPSKEATPSAKASYLLTLAKVKELYRTRHYELALVELVELEKQYPEDEHILSMKGSLQERLGNKALAREAWQQVLNLNPFNLAVMEALQRLGN